MRQNRKAGPGKLQLPGCSGGSCTTGSWRRLAGGNPEVWVQKPRVRSRRHAASQGFDPGAKPGQHWRRPEHPVSADRGPARGAPEQGRAAPSQGGVGKVSGKGGGGTVGNRLGRPF